ncbi:malonyl-ACP O-methyltransferase BioC [Marinomonas ostreistagni]|uniref:malonyl-ACP O-methyltransferase BioC n=1 Tax=Marinomonas ostreistagni TaxID=359209 RepID=UPI0019516BC6|nr:malonyl-ACP O-methyltransferase BioC [Marinomonas ostreistagni]MBM6551236.1 malonyl-ACP O-methyltransferase BioC [Marinomonas ostreistagni]
MTTPSTDNDVRYKRQVAARFSRAADTYDQYARFQEQVVKALAPLLRIHAPQKWLDIGTGTGKGLALLAQQDIAPDVVALDLSHGMLSKVREQFNHVPLVCADAERLPFQNEVFDGLFSSLAVQWCQRPERLFAELSRVLKNDGEVVLSTLLRGSMPELGLAWRNVDGRTHHNHYCTLAELLSQAENAGFKVMFAEQHTMTSWYPCVKEAVYSLKKVGASFVRGETLRMSPSLWKAFEAEYETQRVEQGIPLSYEVALLKLTKVTHG